MAGPESTPGFRSDKDILDYLIDHALYPVMSKRGRVYFHAASGMKCRQPVTSEIVERLGIRNHEDCKTLRDKVRDGRAALRKSRPIRQWVTGERPRERLALHGAFSLPHSTLLAIILRTGKEGVDAEEIGRRLINRFGSLRGIDNASLAEICGIEGIGPAKAVQIKAALELGKRFYREKAAKTRRISRPEDIVDYVAEYYGPYLRDAKKEVFSIILLDVKNKPIGNLEISRGSVSASIVDPGEIIREATLRSASAVILVHNHPSGEAEPSNEDIRVTGRIVEACRLVEIKVLDHVIIGKNLEDYYSFARAGMIK